MNNLKSTQSNNKKTRRKKKKGVLFLLFQIKLCQNQTLREREKKKRKQHKFGIELKRQLKYNNK